ncbi:MAG TPA: conjugal transfer protein TraG, partial [Agrobacterium sp.]|nr:conjugal transfer protein TraG [Agrobacterium sp.]
MTANRILLAVVPPLVMIGIALTLPGIEQWLATFGKTAEAKLTLGRIGLALPYVASAAIALIFLLSAQGSVNIKTAGWGVAAGSGTVIAIAVVREGMRLSQFAGQV